MRSMTKQEAEYYIMAGYFPKENDIEDIFDLQDVFGHQAYHDTINWLINEKTRNNAKKLYFLIWNKDDVNRYIEKADRYIELKAEKEELENKLAQIKCDMLSYHYEEIEDKN